MGDSRTAPLTLCRYVRGRGLRKSEQQPLASDDIVIASAQMARFAPTARGQLITVLSEALNSSASGLSRAYLAWGSVGFARTDRNERRSHQACPVLHFFHVDP